jgi:hypothetical protein
MRPARRLRKFVAVPEIMLVLAQSIAIQTAEKPATSAAVSVVVVVDSSSSYLIFVI